MNRKALNCIESCNTFLKSNTYFSNGKNFCVSQLCETSAKSRLPHENLLGIYLAKPRFTWMALWLAVTSRAHLKKRQVNYFRPDVAGGDFVGRAGIFNPQKLPSEAVFCQKAYLYLIDPSATLELPRLDISGIKSTHDKETMLLRNGFRKETIVRPGENYVTYIPSFTEKLLVDIDEWQVAVVNIKGMIPDAEIVIEQNTIRQLSDRVSWLDSDMGVNYIQ
jgi:hypothetical protein